MRLAALLLTATLAFAQSERPRFEVCDIKLNTSGAQQVGEGFLPGGRVDLRNVPLRTIITAVYKTSDSLLTGPDWLATTRYDIVAKAPPTSSMDQLFEMVKTMLVERFGMTYHTEKKTVSAWALVRGKKPLQLTPSTSNKNLGCQGRGPGAGDPPGMAHRDCHAITMANFARFITQMAPAYIEGLPVVDQTGITGEFDFPVDYMNRDAYNAAVSAGSGDAISVFDALERIGLKLESRKLPADAMMIDKIERTPTEN
jgi:uncharacterized protein (TIGR03435 family)